MYSDMTDFEKTVMWLQKILLPKFFGEHEYDVMDPRLVHQLQSVIDDWQRNKERQDNCKIEVALLGREMVVKVDGQVICTFN